MHLAKTNNEMGKVTNHTLADMVSKRIIELIDITGLTFEGLAEYSGVSESTIRSAYKKTRSISLESLSKICIPFSIKLSDFFKETGLLSIDNTNQQALEDFKERFYVQKVTRHIKGPFLDKQHQRVNHRQERDLIAYVVYNTAYFESPKTIEDMIVDFERDYQISLTFERLYALLQKYVGREVLEKKAIPRAVRRMPASKRPFLYSKLATIDANN